MQTIQNIFDNMEVVTEEAYKNTELLLEQYTKVMFRIEKNIVDIDYELYVVEGKHALRIGRFRFNCRETKNSG